MFYTLQEAYVRLWFVRSLGFTSSGLYLLPRSLNLFKLAYIYIYILCHVDPLLGNDREISKYTTAVTE